MPLTLEEYANKSLNERQKLNKNALKELVDSQLALMQNDPNEISRLITTTINAAIDVKFDLIAAELKADNKKLDEDNKTLRKVITEQQKFLEHIHNDMMRNNVFITGIPNEMTIDDHLINDATAIVGNIMDSISTEIKKDDYQIVKSFNPREGYTRHSAKVIFNNNAAKKKVMDNRVNLHNLDENHPYKKVYLKNESSPLTKKENDRLYTKLRKLRVDKPEIQYSIKKGKLLEDQEVIDEFNINNSLFQ